jgi:hypothetical protein
MDFQLGRFNFKYFYVCFFFNLRVLNLTGSVGTTNEINARRRERKEELLHSLPLNNSHCRDKDSVKHKMKILFLSVFHFSVERFVWIYKDIRTFIKWNIVFVCVRIMLWFHSSFNVRGRHRMLLYGRNALSERIIGNWALYVRSDRINDIYVLRFTCQ